MSKIELMKPREIKISLREEISLPQLNDSEYRVFFYDINRRARQVVDAVLNYHKKQDLSFSYSLKVFEIVYQNKTYYYLIDTLSKKIIVVRDDRKEIRKIVNDEKLQVDERVRTRYKLTHKDIHDNFILYYNEKYDNETYDYSNYDRDEIEVELDGLSSRIETWLVHGNKGLIQVIADTYQQWHFIENFIYYKYREAECDSI